jgi:hypothetical protein
MPTNLQRRVRELESRLKPTWSGVLIIPPHEPGGWNRAVKAALLAAPMPPRCCGYLCVPEKSDIDSWESEAKAEMEHMHKTFESAGVSACGFRYTLP